MSLVFLAADFPPARGGIQAVAYELPAALQRAGVEVGVVAVEQDGAAAFDAACPYPVVRIPGRHKAQMVADMPGGALRLLPQLSAEPGAIVATKWFPEGLAARFTLAARDLPVILMVYGREFRLHGSNPLKGALQHYVREGAAAAVAISQWTADQLRQTGFGDRPIHIVPPGIHPEVFAEPRDVAGLRERLGLKHQRVILTVGRLVARKGFAEVIRALPQVIRSVGRVVYLIAGKGPEEPALRRLVRELGLTDAVRFVGAPTNEDLVDYYHLCDVFTMPTRDLPDDPGEGFGIVYLEANAAGKPVVATRCCGVPDAVEHGVSGLLVPPDDSNALTEALIRVLSDRELAHQLGEAGRRRAREQFTWDRAAEAFRRSWE